MAITREGLRALTDAALAFTEDDVLRCLSRAADLEAVIDNDGHNAALYQEMLAWKELAAKIRATLVD